MKINNAVEFLNFVRQNGLVQLSPEATAFVVCMEDFGRMCQCDPEHVRNAKYSQCKGLYAAFAAKSKLYVNQLLSKTTDSSIVLCTDSQYMATITR